MKTSKTKKINIVDLIFLIAIVAIILFVVVFKFMDKDIVKELIKEVPVSVKYTIEVQNREPQILDYMKEGQVMYEHGSMNPIGKVTAIKERPATTVVEDHGNKTILLKEVSDKICLDIDVESKGKIEDDMVQIEGVNFLIGKSIDCVVGDAVMSGIIVGLDYEENKTSKTSKTSTDKDETAKTETDDKNAETTKEGE